jgi:glycosyltransferase involved in cell wall biosynthesis
MRKKSPKVSVIIPTHNRENLLKRAVKSVLNQTFKDFELIVIDDCSIDNTEQFVEKLAKKDKRIKFIKNTKNLGASISRNTGILKSRGELIAFLDSDDEWMSEKLQMQIDKFTNSDKKKLGFVCCKSFKVDDKDFIIGFDEFYSEKTKNPIKYQLLKGNICSTPSLLIKKDVFRKVGMFEELLSGQEYELVMRILDNGYDFDYVDKFLVKIYQHKGKRISNNPKNKEKGMKDIFKIKNQYFKYLNHNEIIKLKEIYYFELFRFYIFVRSKRKAILVFLKITKNNPYNLKNYIKGTLGLIFGLKFLLWIEKKGEKFKKIYN